MSNLIQQLNKLLKVTLYILNQYLKILYSYKEVQVFFTDLYIKSRSKGSLFLSGQRLPIHKLESLYPGIDDVNINIYAQYKSLSTNIFSNETKYLVSPNELFALSALVKFLRPKKVFEVGTYKGWVLANLGLNLSPEVEIYSIDLKLLAPEDVFIAEILRRKSITKLTGNTNEFDFKQYEGSIDFIFIDAAHASNDVANVTTQALKMLSPKGTIVWHDYNPEHKAVYQYLNQLKNELPIKAIAETSLAIYSRA